MDWVSWFNVKVGVYAFIFRIAILTSPFKGLFFLLSHSSIYCWCTWSYSVFIFSFLLNLHTQLKAVFTSHALLLFDTSFVLLDHPQISLLLPSCPWFTWSDVSATVTLLWLTILGVTQFLLVTDWRLLHEGIACQTLNICWKKLLIRAHISCFPKFLTISHYCNKLALINAVLIHS